MQEKIVSYPELDRIALLYPGPQILLGRDIYWTEKRDGSQLRVWLENGKVRMMTRHMEANEQFAAAYLATPQAAMVEELLREHSGEASSSASDFNFQPVVFGELLMKGRSPARFERHDQNEFVVFDVFSRKSNSFLPFTAAYQTCYHFNVPFVTAWALTRHATLADLEVMRGQMMQKAASEGREGVVLKAYGETCLFAKEKLDTPKVERVERDMSVPRLPPLPDSEVFGAIAKAHADLGEAFFDKRQGMPLVARYVGEECDKHQCGKPTIKLYDAYAQYVSDRREVADADNQG